jgi:hypothetical protein
LRKNKKNIPIFSNYCYDSNRHQDITENYIIYKEVENLNIVARFGMSYSAATAVLVAVLAGSAIVLGPIWAARIYMYFLSRGWSLTVMY